MKKEIVIRQDEEGGFIVSIDRYNSPRKYYAPSYATLSKQIKRCIADDEKQQAQEQKAKDAEKLEREEFQKAEKAAYIEGLRTGKQKPRKNF
jgi:flagellar biosynthesis/type III secretory pathway protein FliH